MYLSQSHQYRGFTISFTESERESGDVNIIYTVIDNNSTDCIIQDSTNEYAATFPLLEMIKNRIDMWIASGGLSEDIVGVYSNEY